jgi:hypothetical protein
MNWSAGTSVRRPMSASGQKQNFKLKHYRNIVILDRKISSILRSIGDNIVILLSIFPAN